MGAGVLIPLLVGRTVDRIRQGDDNLWPLVGALVAAGLLRLGFSVVRRLVAGRVSLGVEYDLRNRMYAHLQSLEVAFFDEQQTGQLMSRATVDLQSVRFFLGYGLIFIIQSAITILVAAAVMLAVNPGLAAIALFPTPFVLWAAYRYGRLNRPASQEVQQRIAELTAEAEESISGVRLVKAFAREERQLARFSRATRRVFDQSMVSTRLRAFYSPLIGFLPQLGLAAVLLVGGRQAVHGTITIGEFVAFYGYVTMLTSPVRMLGVALGMSQRAVASGARVFEILDRRPRMTSKPGAPPLPAGDGHVELRGEIGLVSDDPFLFSDTIRENIAYARPDASDEEVEAAAARAGIHDFIAGLPDGYATLVGERGMTLSGGQRQRVAIARALIKDPRILILDDATSSVDATTEAEIKRALRELMRDRTTFVIGHRLSTVALADEIVVLEEGRIAERGTHEELIERSPLYREIAEKGMPDQVFLTRKPAEPEVAGL